MSENVWRVFIDDATPSGSETDQTYQIITQELEPTTSIAGSDIDATQTTLLKRRFEQDTIRVDTIAEKTASSGVTVDGVLHKDSVTTSSYEQSIYTTVTDINYNGTSAVNAGTSVTLAAGTWLLSWQAALQTDAVNTIYSFVATSNSGNADLNAVSGSIQSLVALSAAEKFMVGGSIIVTPGSSTTYYHMFQLNGGGTSVALDMSIGSFPDPDNTPSMCAVRIG